MAQPRELAEIKGELKAHAKQYAKMVLKSDDPIGEPFEQMTDAAKAIWHDFVKQAIPGVLTGADRYSLQTYCELKAEQIENPRKIIVSKLRLMNSLEKKFGSDPVSREQLARQKEKKGAAVPQKNSLPELGKFQRFACPLTIPSLSQ